MNESKAMLPDRDQMAEIVFNGAHKGLKDCWQWSDPDFDQEHPGRRGYYYKIADAVLAALRASAPQEDGRALEPVAWRYELACARYWGNDNKPGEYTDWRWRLSETKPAAGEGMRNVTALYPAPPSVALEAEKALLHRLEDAELALSVWDKGRNSEYWLRHPTRPQPGGAVAGNLGCRRCGGWGYIRHMVPAACPTCDLCNGSGIDPEQPGGAVAGTERGGG